MIQGASHPTMLLETMSSEKAQHLSTKALRLLGRKEATWSLKPAQGPQEHWRQQKTKEKQRSRRRGTAPMEAASKNKEKPAAT